MSLYDGDYRDRYGTLATSEMTEAQTPEARRHVAALAWALVRATTVPRSVDSEESAVIHMRACRELLKDGILCGAHADTALKLFVNAKGWHGIESVRALFADYVAAGAIELNVPGPDGLPLEVAIASGNLDAVQVVLEHGSDEHLVPSQVVTDKWVELGAGSKGSPAPHDLETFIDKWCPFEQMGSMKALFTAAAMQRRIQSSSGLGESVAPAIAARRRRSGL